TFNRRYALSAAGSYTKQLGSIDVNRLPNAANAVFPLGPGMNGTYSAGDVMTVSIVPRLRLSGYFSLNGLYSLVYTGADSYTLTPHPTPTSPALVELVQPYGVASAT